MDLGWREGGPETFAFLLRRWLDVHVRQIATTPSRSPRSWRTSPPASRPSTEV
ncbi:hypothetical protein NKH77_18905 [Streptomyces sp. M19]